jgi:hypothetical protein
MARRRTTLTTGKGKQMADRWIYATPPLNITPTLANTIALVSGFLGGRSDAIPTKGQFLDAWPHIKVLDHDPRKNEMNPDEPLNLEVSATRQRILANSAMRALTAKTAKTRKKWQEHFLAVANNDPEAVCSLVAALAAIPNFARKLMCRASNPEGTLKPKPKADARIGEGMTDKEPRKCQA